MRATVLAQSLREQRRSLLWWTVGIAAVVAMYVPLYRSYRDSGLLELDRKGLPSGLSEAFSLGDINTPAGYLQSTVFGLIMPLLVIMASVIAGARNIAGDEEAGTLDLVLAHPVSRRRLLTERWSAMLATTMLLTGVACVVTLLMAWASSMGVSFVNVIATSVGLALLGVVFGSLALAVGASVGRRGLALGVAAALALMSYIANSFAPQIDGFTWVQKLSPFYYYLGKDPLRHGFDFAGLARLVALIAVLFVVAIVHFNRRDIAA